VEIAPIQKMKPRNLETVEKVFNTAEMFPLWRDHSRKNAGPLTQSMVQLLLLK